MACANNSLRPITQTETVKLSASLTLAALGATYMNEVLPQIASKKRIKERTSRVRKVIGFYRDYLQREPVVADLEKDAILAFLEVMKGKPWHRNCFDLLRTLRKQALLAGLLQGSPGKTLLSDHDGRGRHPSHRGMQGPRQSPNPRKGIRQTSARRFDEQGNPIQNVVLEEDVGTLWHICCRKYFTANIEIRSEETRLRYRYSIESLQRFLQRTPMPEDLTDDNVIGTMKMLATEKDIRGNVRSPRTVNEIRNRLRALWEWCARRRIVEQFPTLGALPTPKRIPRAWTREQLAALFAGCRNSPGFIAGVKASVWWESLHSVGWDSGERIGALLKARWEHLDAQRGVLTLPAEIRKGKVADALHVLHRDTMALLERMREPQREAIWPWPLSGCSFYLEYRRLLERAGLPYERGAGFHRMRKSVASHLHAAGHNATEALGHSAASVTKQSYLDPSIAGQTSPAQLLFRPAVETKPMPVVPPVVDDLEALAWL